MSSIGRVAVEGAQSIGQRGPDPAGGVAQVPRVDLFAFPGQVHGGDLVAALRKVPGGPGENVLVVEKKAG